jgi:hypothetical protein
VLLGALSLALTLVTTPSRGEPLSATARPHAIKLLINGKSWPLDLLTGGDAYDPVRARTLRVEARWTPNARGTGYYVVVSTAEPLAKVLARCTTGTSCLVPKRLSILVGQEMTLNVKVIRASTKKVVTAYKACIVRRA